LKITELLEESKGNWVDDPEFRTRMINILNNYKDYFSRGLSYGLGQAFPLLDEQTRSSIWNKLMELFKKNMELGWGFGQAIAQSFPSLNQETRDNLWVKVLELIENQDFAAGFGEGIAYVFQCVSKSDFENIITLTKSNDDFARLLGMFCSKKLQSLQQDIQLQERIMELIKRSSLFAASLGFILRESFIELDISLKEILLNEAKRNPSLDNALGFGRCQFCNQILRNDFDSFTRHMFGEHYNIVRENIPPADDIPQECDKCGEIVRSDINDMMKHEGEKHYDSLSEDLKKEYDKWKARGFPKLKDYE
jgi:hypothetical protein